MWFIYWYSIVFCTIVKYGLLTARSVVSISFYFYFIFSLLPYEQNLLFTCFCSFCLYAMVNITYFHQVCSILPMRCYALFFECCKFFSYIFLVFNMSFLFIFSKFHPSFNHFYFFTMCVLQNKSLVK